MLYQSKVISLEKFMKKYLHYEDKEVQEEIAKILNISQTNYSKYELGKINIPISSLKKLFCRKVEVVHDLVFSGCIALYGLMV